MTTMTSETSVVLQKLYEWWLAPEKHDVADELFGSEFDYDPGQGGLRGADFVWWVQQKPAWREVRLLDRVVSGTKGALIFEGIDGTTELCHRVCWLVEIRDGKLVKLLETRAQLQ